MKILALWQKPLSSTEKEDSLVEEYSDSGRISKARGQEHSIFKLNMGNGYRLPAITHIKGTFLQTITSQEEETKYGAEKKELFSAKNHNPFSHIRPENVCSGYLCPCGSMLYDCVHARERACVYDRASPQSSSPFTTSFLKDTMKQFLFEALSKNH